MFLVTDALSKPIGTHQTLQTTAASCHFSNTVSTSHRSITSRTLLTSATPSWTLTQGTPQKTPTKTSVTEKTGVHISEESKKAAQESVDHLQGEKVHEDMALASTLPKTAAEPEPQLKPEDIKVEDEPKQFQEAQMVESKTDESALISVSADQPKSLSQTPETESWAGPFTDPARVSEEGKDEDTEVSVEIARISHAPKVAWEENKTVTEDEKDDTSEIDVRSENISESHTVEYGDMENDTLTSSPNTNILASSFLEQGALGDFGCQEETIEDLMRVDEQDIVSNISEEVTEQLNSETDAAIDSINKWDRQEPESETNVMSPESEVEEEGEMSIDTDIKDKAEDENVTEIEEEEIEVIERDISVQDGGVDSPKNIDLQESIEKTVPPAEAHSDQAVNEDRPLPEESEGEEENRGDEDDSPNISASWRTDPGECDSYSQENTLADTRPLIRYKSDEETDGNVQASHLIGETSNSEDERERVDGGHWNESATKRFNTMEDLTEEPDMDVIGEMMTEDVVSKEETRDDDERAHMTLQSVSGVNESLDVEKEMPIIELRGNLEEDSGDDDMREMGRDEDHDVKVYEQNENPQLIENQHIHTEQLEYETVHSYESQEHVDMDHPSPFSETSQQEQLEISFETSPTLTMSQDAATTKEPENLLDVSMHTNMDLIDSYSLESEPNIMTSDMPKSDQEDCNSSEDESPNASQCFQNTSLFAEATLTEQPLTFTNGVSKTNSVSDSNDVPEEVLSKEKSTEEAKASQIDDWENSNIWGKSMSIPDAAEFTHGSMDENSGVFPVNETENLGSPNKMPNVAENIFEEHLERTVESFSEKVMDFESNNSGEEEEEEEFDSKEKKSEIHSFFSTSLKEDFWNKGKVEMAATYDPAKTEDFNQAMVFGEEWKDMEGKPAANGNPKEEMDILKVQDEKHKDEQPTQGKMVQSDDSVDEGDSWSSGDE